MTKQVKIGTKVIGGGSPVLVQSMTTTHPARVEDTVRQILQLEEAGCDIVRVAVPDREAAEAMDQIKEQIHIPLVVDIHFDGQLAVICMERGVDKVRINPGNIRDKEQVARVARLAKSKKIPIRIGVNAGSIGKALLDKYGSATPEAMVESACNEIKLLEQEEFDDIVLSLKASDVKKTVEAYRMMHQISNYPLHLGVTEAGNEYAGLVKSSIGIGSLLLDGIGDTIRVSLTADPVKEVEAAQEILCACGLGRDRVNLVSCPTCGRCGYDLIPIVNILQKKLKKIHKPITVAVMGCVVNGPGEAKEADIGVAGGKEEGILFKKGRVVRKIPYDKMVEELLEEIESL